MDEITRIRTQIRVVLVVLRSEIERLNRWELSGSEREAFLETLRSRSLEILDSAQARLDGDAPSHRDLAQEIELARAEVIARS